jgi:hypothetical protein
MSWDCCTPTGACQRGHGCPAGGACHSQPGCADTACPGHPGQVLAARKTATPDLRRVQLDGTRAGGRKARRSALAYLCKRLLQLVVVVAVVFVLGLASLALPLDDDNAHKRTHWTEAA